MKGFRYLSASILGALLVLLVGSAWLAAQGEVTAGAANLITNNSFESGDYDPGNLPQDWESEAFISTAEFTWSDEEAQLGQRSMQITAESPNDALVVQTVKVKQNTTYLFTGWIKTENVQTNSAGANLCINGTFEHTPGLSGTNDWTFVSMLVETTNETVLSLCARLGYWSDATSGTAWFDNLKFVELSPNGPKPNWRVLVLVYQATDFTYTDGGGTEHRVQASMTTNEMNQAAQAARNFLNSDVPKLSSGNLVPRVTVRFPTQTISDLSPFGSDAFWLGPDDIAQDLGPNFDAVIVIWDPEGTDIKSGQPEDLSNGEYDSYSPDRGTNQTYSLITARAALDTADRNDFKWAFGRSLLTFFDAAGVTLTPMVNNSPLPTEYVNCVSGQNYVWEEETIANPIPNSIYNNNSGFTHDYYSGQTALAINPTRCLGISPQAWVTGGPVSGPLFYSFGAEADPDALMADPGMQVIYQLQVENQGNQPDTYQVSFQGNQWPVNGPDEIGPLAVDEMELVPLNVTIPQGADGFAEDTLTVRLQSTAYGDVSGTLELVTTANAIYDFSAVPDAANKNGEAGSVVSYTVSIQNSGNITDSYTLQYDSDQWAVDGPPSAGPVARDQSTEFVVAVTIPADATGLQTDDLDITITSQGDGDEERMVNLTTTAGAVYAFSAAAVDDQKSGDVGTGVVYNIDIENQGNITDTYDVQVGGNQWTVDMPTESDPVGPGQSTSINVTVNIPQNALGNATDTAVVTLVSQGEGSEQEQVELTTEANPFNGLDLSPQESSAFGIIGTTKEHILTIKNTGNVSDRFNLNSSGGSWQVDIPDQTSVLAPGQSENIEVKVTIPESADDGEEQTTIITVTSENDSGVASGSALTTMARWPVVYSPVIRR